MAHIEARDITLTYQTPSGAVPAVHGVSFGIETSEFLCIVGPSGCGKSTLFNIVAGFLSPTARARLGSQVRRSRAMEPIGFRATLSLAHRTRQCRLRVGNEGCGEVAARGDRARTASPR